MPKTYKSDYCPKNCKHFNKGCLFAGFCKKYNIPLDASRNTAHPGLIFKCFECRK